MLQNEKGFTLVEFICVMAVLAIFAAVLVVKFDVFNGMAKDSALLLAVEELNKREKMHWFDVKLTDEGYIDDLALFNIIDYDLGKAKWKSGPKQFGGTLLTDGGAVVLIRTASTKTEPGSWRE